MGASREILAEAKTRGKLKSVNPATLESLGEVEIASAEQVRMAVDKARAAQPAWGALPIKERLKALKRAKHYVVDHLEELAQLITKENGKPIPESLSADLLPFLDMIDWLSKSAPKILKDEKISLPFQYTGRKSRLEHQPAGVVGVISPWNFPFNIPAGQIAMALAAGNAVILKPSEYTPFIGRAVAKTFEEAGLPENVFQIVSGDGETGGALVKAAPHRLLFTGSVRTGQRIMADAAENLTTLGLELGGKGAMVVCKDAHLENVTSAAVWGAFANAGQVCASVERCYVHESIADEFTRKVVEKTKRLRQGNGLEEGTDVGPMTTLEQFKNVEQQVAQARDKGAEILTGGKKNDSLPGWFWQPTVLRGVDHSFACMTAETFGPLLPIMTFKDENEVIGLANDSHLGLTGSVWTKDLAKGQQIASKVQAGTVMVNELLYTYAIPGTPWGGPKKSGIGRTHGEVGLLELTELHHVHTNTFPQMKDPWWFGYQKAHTEGFLAGSRAMHARTLGERLKALLKLPGVLFKADKSKAL
ncbi:MAG: aldehyde dehydrogenase family protein [Bdellovibrionota bacterium]